MTGPATKAWVTPHVMSVSTIISAVFEFVVRRYLRLRDKI